ncbi:Gldg family protein [Thalassobellus suaedae]|uniref:Gldg family protein n=1 Tax=Thalassobellus suaedae TaxID=3074124 RepID=A0ABY9XVG5_9FLAO|nr:Gldg family protein [Flavobacteriaceae bacterium HL-DH14]
MNKTIKHIVILIIALIAINILSYQVFKRFDLTEDARYTLSDAAVNIIKDVESPIIVDVFLEGEDFPSEFRRLQRETKQLLEEFSAKNNHIIFHFINPLEDESSRELNIQQLSARGLTPMQLSVEESGKSTQAVIFPWALVPVIKTKLLLYLLLKTK